MYKKSINSAETEHRIQSRNAKKLIISNQRIIEVNVTMENLPFIVDSQRVQFNGAKGTLLTAYDYQTTRVEKDASGKLRVKPVTETLTFKTACKVPRVGCMLVGWGGNNGCTVTAAVLANKFNLEWRTRDGVKVRLRMRHI